MPVSWRVTAINAVSRWFWGCLCALTVILSSALATEPPADFDASTDAGTLLRDYERLEQYEDGTLPELQQRPERPPLQRGEGQTVEVRDIVFSGATELVGIPALQSLTADAIGMSLDFDGLQQLVNRVTDFLKAEGWFLARAYLPQQDVTAGVIEIVILAGELSAAEPVRIVPVHADFQRIVPEVAERVTLAALPAGQAVREENINRAVLLIDDLPGVSAQSRLTPGPETGTSTIVMMLEEGPLWSGDIRTDNYGSDSTGVERATLTTRLNNPSGAGDRITLSTTQNEGSELYRGNWLLPIGSHGLTFDIGVTNLQYDTITPQGKLYGIEGRTRTNTQALRYPIVRSRTRDLWLNINGRQQHMIDRANGAETSNKRKNSVAVSLEGTRLDTVAGGGRTSWSVGLTAGDLDLKGNAEAYMQDQQTYRTHGSFQKAVFRLSRLQQLADNLTLQARLDGQFTNQNLDSSEQLSLGGLAGVRGYPSGEAGGDNAGIVQLELRYRWPRPLPGRIAVQSRAFIDSGWVQLREDPYDLDFDTATERNTYTLHGAGLGITLSRDSTFQASAIWAHTLGDNPGRSIDGNNNDGSDDSHRFYLQASARF